MIAPLALALLQDAPKPRTPDAAVYDALIKKTNELKAFVAEYRVEFSQHEGKIRLAYRAPGDLRVEMLNLPGNFVLQLHDGVIDAAGSPSGGAPITAHVPIEELFRVRRSRLTEVLHSELPASNRDWVVEPDCGVAIELQVSPSRTDEKEDFQFQAGYRCQRTALLGWLEFLMSQDDVRNDGDDALALTTSRGTKLKLSTRTGFLERIEKENERGRLSFELASLDLDPKFDAKSFQIPAPEKGAQEASIPFSAQMQQGISLAHRTEVYGWISRHVEDKSLAWNQETRGHARKVFECIHSDALAGEAADVLETTKEQFERLGKFLGAAYGKLDKDDGAGRGEFDAKVDAERNDLVAQLQRFLDARNSTLSISERTVPDAALRDDLNGIEKAAAEAAFARVVQDPVLEAFDGTVSKAKGGG